MPSPARLVVAIDGPAGAGKSTVSRLAASMLGLALLDTGAMYRCAALECLARGVDLDDHSAAEAAAKAITIEFRPGNPQDVLLNGEVVTEAIRTPQASEAASRVSVISGVRREMVRRQQEFVAQGGVVLEGRDTTTVVAPLAQLKVFLTASSEERARRRWLELRSKGQEMPLQDVVRDVVSRDYRDYMRDDSPLSLAEDAHIIESFGRTPEDIASEIVRLAEAL